MLLAISAGLYTHCLGEGAGEGGDRLVTHGGAGLLHGVVGLEQLSGMADSQGQQDLAGRLAGQFVETLEKRRAREAGALNALARELHRRWAAD
jgi:hypothetical protein